MNAPEGRKSSGAFFNKLLCIQKSTTGRMTLFSESGILSVKTGGIRDEKGKSNDEKLGALCI